jgi:hypothetical protein
MEAQKGEGEPILKLADFGSAIDHYSIAHLYPPEAHNP